MLTLITGTPGSGKTLWTIFHVENLAKEAGRPVYYFGIDDLTLDWIKLENAEDWHKAPDGAIIVLDECWQLFRTRPVGSAVPEYVEPMATHRHRGHDVFVITQHSTQVDTFIRKMVGSHVHFKRSYGMARSTRFEWNELANERDKWERKAAATSSFKFPTGFYGVYKSAELNTVKSKPPVLRIALLVGGVLLVPMLLWGGVAAIWPDDEEEVEQSSERFFMDDKSTRPAVAQRGRVGGEAVVARPNLYDIDTWRVRTAAMPFSAVFYDKLIKPVAYPRISGCGRLTYADGRDDCFCNDQQGNTLRVSYRVCLDFIKYGQFDFSRPDEEFQQKRVESTSGPSGSNQPASQPQP